MKSWEDQKGWRASYTVEAALVFPILFAILVFLLFVIFYAHDIVVQKAVCYETALEAVHGCILENPEMIQCIRLSEEELSEYAKRRILDGIIDGKERKISIDLEGIEKRVYIEGQESSKAVCEELNTSDFIRNVRRIRIMTERVKEEWTQVGGGYDK